MYTLATSEKECIFFHIAIAGHPASPVAKCLGAGRGALAEQLAEPRPWWPCRDGQLSAKIRNGGGMPGARDQRHIKRLPAVSLARTYSALHAQTL